MTEISRTVVSVKCIGYIMGVSEIKRTLRAYILWNAACNAPHVMYAYNQNVLDPLQNLSILIFFGQV